MRKSASKSKTSSDAAAKPAAQGLLIVISAPSGCGKTTIVERLLKRHPDWVRSVSFTTRPAREGERDRDHYHFVTTQRFDEMEAQGEFLESARVFDQRYGTPKAFVSEKLKEGKHVLLAIDVQGTRQIKKKAAGLALLTFFVLPPSVRVLRERLEGRRTESPDEIQRRIETAQEEIKEAAFYDCTVVNQNLDQTVLEIEEHIERYKKERSPNSHAVHFP